MRFGVSAVIIAALLAIIPIRDLRSALGRVSVTVLISSLLIFMVGHVAAALKWRILQGGHTGLSLPTVLRAHFFGVVANLWLPGVVGGDLVRAGSVFRQSTRPALVAVASLVDRIVDSVGLMLLAGGGLLLVGAPSQNASQILLAVVAIAVVGGLVLIAVYRFVKMRFANNRRVIQLIEAVDLTARRPGLVTLALLISVAVQATFIIVNMNLGRAIGMTAPLSAWFLAWPLAKLAALIPVSVAGLGVREAALVVLLQPFGDSAGSIMAAGLLWQGVFVAGGISGWAALSLVPDATPVVHEPLQSSNN
jgi:uncharacterized membrane protein YbhN (UPF0104 family)